MFEDETSPRPTDIFVLFLTARDRHRAGMIEEIAIGVIGSTYKDFIFYESLDAFMGGYAMAPVAPDKPDDGGSTVKLRKARKPFVPPETLPDKEVGDGTTQ